MPRHDALSELWVHLENRHDIASILREIVGQHALDSTLQDDAAQSMQDATRYVVWIKTIFDLQRTYLSGLATGISESPPYVLSSLLPAELLLSTIFYLINIKSRIFPSQTTLLTREFIRQRHALAQAVLSGLRLLVIRGEAISPQEKWRLQTAINTAWQHDRLSGVECFVVSELFASVLDSVNELRAHDYMEEWSNARLPTYHAGLYKYPLDLRPETFVTGLVHGTFSDEWPDAYWVLFDILWAVESAVTQRYVDLRRQYGGTDSSTSLEIDSDETLEMLHQTRTSLLATIFNSTAPKPPTPVLLDSLACTLLDWNDDLESFLSRQDSLLRPTNRVESNRSPSYGKQLSELKGYYEIGETSLLEWLSNRKPTYEQFSIKPAVSSGDMQEIVREWLVKMTSSNAETQAKDLNGPVLPVYIVNCPKLHVLPKRLLEYKLRWCDKWAYESVQENSPVVNWKEGIQCPSCPSGDKVKFARLVEPFQHLANAFENFQTDNYSLSQYSTGEFGSMDAASATSISEGDSATRSQTTMPSSYLSSTSPPTTDLTIPSKLYDNPPAYLDSPVSPALSSSRTRAQGSYFLESPVSPYNESLNVPIPMASRMSIDLPIPVNPNSEPIPSPGERSETPSNRKLTPPEPSKSTPSLGKLKTSKTVRIADALRRRPTNKEKEKEKETFPLPKDPQFRFSTSGHSLLLWGKLGDHVVRFDIPSNDNTLVQGCRYDVSGVEAAAAGNHKCAVIARDESLNRKLVVYNGTDITPESEIELESGRSGEICLAVSRNDQYIAMSLNDRISIFELRNGIKLLPFHHQIQVYELRGGQVHRRTIPVGRSAKINDTNTGDQFKDPGWFGSSGKGISSKEAAEEAQRSGAVVSRKLYFSPDNQRLVVATQLGDHHVYVDVWDVSRQPVSMISENSRSFPLPPWTLNDGDLTGIFYDSAHRCAILTAFLGKEYPLMIPFPGYDELQNETYSTKIICAAQSPGSQSFLAVNAMAEIIQFEYTQKGILAPHKLKKAASKIHPSIFRPGNITLAMPLEDRLQCFWIRDGKCMLRSVKLSGAGEVFKECDIRLHYDRLMNMKTKPIIVRAPTLRIPELDTGDADLGLPLRTTLPGSEGGLDRQLSR